MKDISIWIELIISIITGLVVCIPLIIKLVQFIQKAIKEKNWAPMMQLILKLMTEAEENYSTGAEKKQYVLDSIKALEGTLNYDVDIEAVSAMIDSVILATKKINVNKTKK